MDNASPSVPFKIANAYGGLADCNGLARATDDGLLLEFEAKDGFFGVLKSGVKSLVIAWSELANLRLRKGWFGTRLHLTVHSLRTLQEVPGAEACEVSLRVARRNRAVAEELAMNVNFRLCERELRRGAVDPRRNDRAR